MTHAIKNPDAVRYPLYTLIPSWMGGDGYIAGLPVMAIVFNENQCKSYKLHDLFERIAKELPRGDDKPRMVAFLGDERYFDDQLLTLIRLRLSLPCYAEYCGERTMHDRLDMFPRWDHASVRLRHAGIKISGAMLFHSVVVPTPTSAKELVALGQRIDQAGYKVTRYASASGQSDAYDARVVRKAASSGFRMTRPVFNEPIPITV